MSSCKGSEIQLEDIANVIDSFELEQKETRFNGKPTILISVYHLDGEDGIIIVSTHKSNCDSFSGASLKYAYSRMNDTKPSTDHRRTLVIGDVHGCLDALITLAAEVKFSPEDKIIFLGDYVDRGPDSMKVLDWFMEKSQTLNIITLKGNHELMMQNSLSSIYDFQLWVSNGGIQTLESFDSDLSDVDSAYWDFIDKCPLYHETDDFIFVHAGPSPNEPLDDQGSNTLCWLRFNELKAHHSNKIIICGHTPQCTHIPAVLPHAVCIDTHAFNSKGYLTCLEVNTGEYWQANQADETRSNKIKMPTNANS